MDDGVGGIELEWFFKKVFKENNAIGFEEGFGMCPKRMEMKGFFPLMVRGIDKNKIESAILILGDPFFNRLGGDASREVTFFEILADGLSAF